MSDLGTTATVFVHSENGEPRVLDGEGRAEVADLYGPVDDFPVVSVWAFQAALYALQNPTPENIAQALECCSTDCGDFIDPDTLLPLPIDPPHGWRVSS